MVVIHTCDMSHMGGGGGGGGGRGGGGEATLKMWTTSVFEETSMRRVASDSFCCNSVLVAVAPTLAPQLVRVNVCVKTLRQPQLCEFLKNMS